MKIVHVVSDLTTKGAGLSEAVRNLAIHEASCSGYEIYAIGFALPNVPLLDWSNIHLHKLMGSHGYSRILSSLLDTIEPDIVHIHGLWVLLGSQARFWCIRRNIPFVVSPHGMLDAWAWNKSRIKKALYWFADRHLLAKAAGIHALNQRESDQIKLRLPAELHIIPNGVELPPLPVSNNIKRPRQLLFLSRIDPKKSVLELIEAWKNLQPQLQPGSWSLVIAGSGAEDYETSVHKAAAGCPDVSFLGHVSGVAKTAAYAAASVFVLPSKSEGLPIAALEAWSYGLPVAMTHECWLPEGFTAGAAKPIHLGPNLVQDLLDFLQLDDSSLTSMGLKGRALVETSYQWPQVADSFLSWYSQLIHKVNSSR